jgi:hypothetical protein
MSPKSKIILVVITVVTAYAFGRFSAPEKVKIETKIVTVEKKVKDTDTTVDKNRHKKVVIVEETKPDGTKTKTTTITDDTTTKSDRKTKETDKIAQKEKTSKEVISSSAKLTVSAMAGVNLGLTNNPLVYGASVSKTILGPISLGAFYLTPSIVGATIGLSF